MNAPNPQECLLTFISDPRSYPDTPRRIRLLETHSCWVALTPRYAYKIKKPVNLGFLDFSTLEKRRECCEREVTLNRRLCPDIYLDVLPIRIHEGCLSFETGGRVVEYAVKMRRLSERFFMLARMKRGEISRDDVNSIVGTLRSFYGTQSQTSEIAKWGRVSKLRISTNENFQQAGRFIGTTISASAFHAIRLFTTAFYRHHRALFDSRIREGRILDCHGDLHLEHIHLSPDRLTIFDCIEFNDRFRYIDVANDVAFLAMDFAYQGRPDLGRHFAVQMARSLNDPDLLRILGFYQCYRAYVRGKVESIQQASASVSAAVRQAIHFRAESYFRLALRYAVCGSEPMVLIVMGRVGSGKSTLAQALAHELGCKAYSSDRIRKELVGTELYKRGSASDRRRLYSSKMSDKTYATLARHALEALKEHRTIVLDATFAGRRRRDALQRKLADAKAAWCFIEVRAAPATILRRLKARDSSTSEVSDARVDDLPFLNQSYEPPTELDEQHFVAVKSARNIDSVIRATLSKLAQRRARWQD